MSWITTELKNVTVKIGSGSTPRGGAEAYKESGISLIRSQNILDLKFSEDGLAFIDDRQAESLKNVTVEENDVLLNITGDSVARCCGAPKNFLPARVNQHVAILRADKSKLNSDFLKYYLFDAKEQLLVFSEIGGTRNALTKNMLENFSICLPPLPEQQAIASVLSALDDKIDLLQRQNQTLEQMAATLFRQWFIEEAKEDWETYCLKDLANIYIGRTPPRKESHWFSNSNKDYKWISIKDMADSGTFTIQTNEYLSKNTIDSFKIPVIPTNTVILSFKMTVGRVKITLEDMVSNEAIAQFQIKKLISKEFLYCFLKQYNFDTLGSTSSIVTAVNTALIKDIEVTIPNTELVEKFTDSTYSMFNKIRDNQIQIQTLQSMRDTLLPKLISGEVRLKGFETLLQA